MTKYNKIFATDMDGTFLRNDHHYDEERLMKLLDKLEMKNDVFAVSSGRAEIALRQLFKDVEDRIAYVGENGALVSYENEKIFIAKFEMGQIRQIIDAIRALPDGTEDFLISGHHGAYVPETCSEDYFEKIQTYYVGIERVKHIEDVEDDLLKITTNFPDTKLAELSAVLETQLPFVRVTTTGFTSIDIIPKGVTKATGLDRLAKHMGLEATDVVAFGDQMNDYEMLQYAGVAVAVENAVDDIKAVADYVIGTNDDSSVLAEMERLISSE
ncbi:MAG: Cof-type HAD-IIB family hydrolase [Streptococcaceae bacterium]|jgi:Cof subfamily protein (haloacid dehalogenase superfamily)|nr:Cof-type HAD-IIB family hydrolase [Streptococcaceae bacterium]